MVGAASPRDPVAVHGRELADGRAVTEPPSAVWGSGIDRRNLDRGIVRLRDAVGPLWVAWSEHRGGPDGILFAELPAPGTVTSPERAEAIARAFIATHVELLAPGSRADDFVAAGNDLSRGIRTVGFVQHHDGIAVEGGQIGFRFMRDRLVLVTSQARPHVDVPKTTGPQISDEQARAAALADIAREWPDASLSADAPDGVVILPLFVDGRWRYQLAVRVVVHARAPLGEWMVYVDAHGGQPIARDQRMHSAATVRFDVPVRHAASTREDMPAAELDLLQSGMAATTDLDGVVSLSSSPTTLEFGASGPRVNLLTNAGAEVATSIGVSDGGIASWSLADDEFGDAQLSAFIHVSRIKSFVRAIDPDLAWLDEPTTVTVNIEGSCNAMSNGDSLFFLRADGSCQNTARIADVVYHEAGHSVHRQSIIVGVGGFDGALSEGISDYLAATYVDDSGMGRGFTYNDDPLREIDPDGYEYRWPEDQSPSPHQQGRIISGALWDLREALRDVLGDQPGRAHADILWYESIRRAVDIPSMYPEALIADDDDGDLGNGTPNVCTINAAFSAHGLLDPSELGDLTVDLVATTEGRRVAVSQMLPMFPDCPLAGGEAALRWRLRGDPEGITVLPMTIEDGSWVATIPKQEVGVVVEYQVVITYDDGTEALLPRNAADPWYQTFFGGTAPIYCLDGDADQSAWSFSGGIWGFGPLAANGGLEPASPFDDDGVLLDEVGEYQPNSSTTATSPTIDISGHTDVRLHMRRWLTVEDGTYDRATLGANGQVLFANAVTELTHTHHVDREWRFVDIPLDDFLGAGQVQLEFGLSSDQGLEFGGWTVDALCVVEVVPSVCGDGTQSDDEACDDGNTEDGDGCDAQCFPEEPEPSDSSGGMDGTTGDDGPATEDGGGAEITGAVTDADDTAASGSDSSGGGAQDGGASDGCGCASDRGSGHGWAVVLLVALGRRRRCASRSSRA